MSLTVPAICQADFSAIKTHKDAFESDINPQTSGLYLLDIQTLKESVLSDGKNSTGKVAERCRNIYLRLQALEALLGKVIAAKKPSDALRSNQAMIDATWREVREMRIKLGASSSVS